MANIVVVFGTTFVLFATICVGPALGGHLSSHRLEYSPEDTTLTLNERFFNDVRALIKRRLQENAAIRMRNVEVIFPSKLVYLMFLHIKFLYIGFARY